MGAFRGMALLAALAGTALAAAVSEAGTWCYRPYEYEAWMLQRMRAEADRGVLHFGYPGTFLRLESEPEAFYSEKPVEGYESIPGEPGVPPHRLERPLSERAATCVDGVYDLGRLDIGYVYATSPDRPNLFVGESLPEVRNSDANGFEQSVLMVPDGGAGRWRSDIPLALRYFRFGNRVRACSFRSQVDWREPAGSFACGDARKEKMWRLGAETVRRCTRTFALDAIKRDRLPWAADLVVYTLADAYTFGDPEPVKRTLAALGSGDVTQSHVNGIASFSLWWVIAHDLLQRYFGEPGYLKLHYPKIKARVTEIATHEDGRGFLAKKLGWDFMDWTDRKGGTLRSEVTRQVIYFGALKAAVRLAKRMRDDDAAAAWNAKAERLKATILSVGMDRTRHARMLAIVFGLVEGETARRYAAEIAADDLLPTVTPYMATFEVMALVQAGEQAAAMKKFESVWGEMVDFGVDAYWEGWDHADKGNEIYEYYGRPFAKSLCHAWASGPAFLIPGVFLGIRPTADGWAEWERKPLLPSFAPRASVVIPKRGGPLTVNANGDGHGDYLVVDLEKFTTERLSEVPSNGWTVADKTRRLVLRRVPAGEYLAGEPLKAKFRRAFETPRKAKVAEAFHVGVFEVTQGQWRRVMGCNPSVFEGETRPIENVSYERLVSRDGFLARLRAKTGLAFDLPTDEQWEWACRAGTTTPFSAPVELVSDESDPALDAIGRCWENGGANGGTAEVGSYAANPWGLYDVHGNVWEWTHGRVGDKRCVRGGGHSDYPVCCRSASRLPVSPAVGTSGFGLRVVVNPAGERADEPGAADAPRAQGEQDVPWSAAADGKPLVVHWARSMDPVPFYSILEDRGGTYAFASFDLAAPTVISLKPASRRDLSRTRIRPEGVPARIVGIGVDEVKVKVDAPCKFSLEPDGCRAPVFVFAEAPERNLPDFADPKVKVVEPGLHQAGEKGVLVLKDGETLYLKRGAVLEGSVVARGRNIRICGRGILDGSRWEWHRHPYGRMLEADHCANLTVEDITIRGSGVWTIVPVGCDGVTVRNVKICNGRVQNDDGLDVCNSRNVLVEDCFFRTNDDAIALKGLVASDGDVENVTVRNSTFWVDFARFALLGHESRARCMRNVRFENIDVLNFRLPVFLLEPGEDMLLEDVRADSVRIDNDRPGKTLEIVRVRPTVNVYMKRKIPGFVRDAVFSGLTVRGEACKPVVTVEDYDETHRAENVVLRDSDAGIEFRKRAFPF